MADSEEAGLDTGVRRWAIRLWSEEVARVRR